MGDGQRALCEPLAGEKEAHVVFVLGARDRQVEGCDFLFVDPNMRLKSLQKPHCL